MSTRDYYVFLAGASAAFVVCYALGTYQLHRQHVKDEHLQREEWAKLHPTVRDGIREAMGGPES